jgi:hypothetical protein
LPELGDFANAIILTNLLPKIHGLLEFECRNYNKAHDCFNEAVRLATNDVFVAHLKEDLELTTKILLKHNGTRNESN